MTWFRKSRRDTHSRLSLHSDVRASFHLDGLTLLHIPTGRVFVCNRIGALICRCILKGWSADSIADEISRHFCLSRDLVQRDICEFVDELRKQGIAGVAR